jgi:hypothetical protein
VLSATLRAALPYSARTLAPASLGAVVALGVLPAAVTVARGGTDLSTACVAAAVVGGAALAHAVDDPDDGVLVASPTPRWARRSLRLLLACAFVVAGWAVVAVLVALSTATAPPLADRVVEALAAGGIAVAVAASARQRYGIDPAALAGGAAGVVSVLTVTVLSLRLDWLPRLGGGPHHGRWWIGGIGGWSVAAWEARDPAR